jgi:hypothetical protein
MGHGQVQTTARYAHLAHGYLAAAVERLAAPEPVQTDTAIDTELLELAGVTG